MRASATIIQDKAHEALTDLRGVLGVLRDPETGEPLEPPQPTYADLAQLVDEARAAGLQVSATTTGSATRPTELPDVIGRTRLPDRAGGHDQRRASTPRHACCIVVQRLARGRRRRRAAQPARRSRRRHARAPGSGWSGLTERAELRGGRLEGRREDGTFVLHGWIPWAA